MRILVLCYEYPPLGGGGGRVAAQVAAALVERGHEVRFITGGMPHLPKRSVIDGVEVIRVRSGRKKEDTCTVLEMLFWVVAAFPIALRESWQWKPEVMHAHFAVPTGFVAWLVHLFTRIPYILTAHLGDVPGGVPEQTERLFKIVKPFTIPLWRAAAQVTAVSSFVASLAKAAYGLTPKTILNAWCTAGSFGSRVRFCGPDGVDQLDRFAQCAQLVGVARQCFTRALLPVNRHMAPSSNPGYVISCFACFACFAIQCYNQCRNTSARLSRGTFELLFLSPFGGGL